MKSWKIILIVIVIIIIVGLIVYGQQVSAPNPNQFGEKEFSIEKGQSVSEIIDGLVNAGFLEKPFWFKIYVGLHGYRSSFVDGKYLLKTDMNIKELVTSLMNQLKNEETEIKVIEGWTVEEMDASLAEQGAIVAGDLIKYSNDFKGISALQQSIQNNWSLLRERPVSANLEGFLYPDTYRIFKQTAVEKIVGKMLNNFHAKVTDDLIKKSENENRNFFEILTLASIVEKEVVGYEDRKKVANVFQKRLEIGMPLQADSTINYFTKSGRASSTQNDLEIDNPYNTYKYNGLPPGPICNPSIESIRAVIEAEKNAYWYFLTALDGQVYYANDHDGHVRNKQRFLQAR